MTNEWNDIPSSGGWKDFPAASQWNDIPVGEPRPKEATPESQPSMFDLSSEELTPSKVLKQELYAFNTSFTKLADLFLPGDPITDWYDEMSGGPAIKSGLGKTVADAIGIGGSMGVGFVGVERAAGTYGNALMDLLGIGMSQAGATAQMQAQTAKALSSMDAFVLGPKELKTPDAIADEVQRLYSQEFKKYNLPVMDAYESSLRAQVGKGRKAKAIAKDEARILRDMIDAGDVLGARRAMGFYGILDEAALPSLKVSLKDAQDIERNVLKTMDQSYGKTADEVRDAVKQVGNVKIDPVKAVFKNDNAFARVDGTDKRVTWWDKYTLPIADAIRKYVDTKVGGMFERSAETAARMETHIPEILIRPYENLVKFGSEDRELKRFLMDAHRDPQNVLNARARVRQLGGTDAVKQFDEWVNTSELFNGRIRKKLFNAGDTKLRKDDVFFHMEKNTRGKKNDGIPRIGKSDTEKPSALQERSRKPAALMSDAEVDEYVNPFLSQSKYIADMEHLIQITDNFGLKPGMKFDSTVASFFDHMAKDMTRRGMSEAKAAKASKFMQHHYMGMTHAPNPFIRGLMSLGYAGTLAQPKSATLNLADVAVSMANQGIRPTVQAVFQTTKGQLGKNLTELGIDNAQNVGEFMRQFDKYIQEPGALETFARVSHKVSDFSMLASGFKFLDRTGKGVILRAAVNQAKAAAKNGTLAKTFGDVMTPDELRRIRPYLEKGIAPKDMPKEVQKLVEELAFTSLGKQQLISTAGRPLAYLNNPTLRPAYAMTGFAIKQLAMLRKGVLWNFKKNPGEAAKYAAKYVALAAGGTSLLNESRESIFQNREFQGEDVLIGTLEQLAAVATMNKVSDPYAVAKMKENPVMFILESLLPPMGLTEAAMKTAGALILGGEWDDEIVKKVPALGDFYKYYWADKTPKDRGSHYEQYKQLMEKWGQE